MQIAEGNANAHLLEGDGIVTNLFYYIWKQRTNAAAQSASTLSSNLYVPSTVILEHNFPKAWYYSRSGGAHGSGHIGDEDVFDEAPTGDLERKLGRDVDTQLILKDFSDHGRYSIEDPIGGDVVAAYYSTVDVDGEPVTRVEFLDFLGVTELLLRRSRRPDGFLQKWVAPCGKYNTVIQAVWSPHLCRVSKRASRLALKDKRYPLFDRCCTYEGPTHYSNEVFVAPHVQHQVKGICKELVEHLLHTQKMAVQRMVLHFKVDHNSHIWLLYCSSMRVTSNSQLNLAPTYVRRGPNEEADEQLAAAQLAKILRHDAYENETPASQHEAVRRSLNRGVFTSGAQTKTGGQIASLAFGGSICGGLGGSGADRPLEAYHPRPPSMGPLGDMFTDVPNWTKRYKRQIKERKKHPDDSPESKRQQIAEKVKENQILLQLQLEAETTGAQPKVRPAVPKPPKAKRKKRRAPNNEENEARLNLVASEESVAPAPLTSVGSNDALSRSRSSRRKISPSKKGQKERDEMIESLLLHYKKLRVDHDAPDAALAEALSTANYTAGAGAAAADASVRQARKGIYRRFGARMLWAVLRLAVLSGVARYTFQTQAAREWCLSFLYAIYSHFTCRKTHLNVRVPVLYDRLFGPGWMTRIGLQVEEGDAIGSKAPVAPTSTESVAQACSGADKRVFAQAQSQLLCGAVTTGDRLKVIHQGEGITGDTVTANITAVKAPLLLLQSRLLDILKHVLELPNTRLKWYFVAQRYLLFRRFTAQLESFQKSLPLKQQESKDLVKQASSESNKIVHSQPPSLRDAERMTNHSPKNAE